MGGVAGGEEVMETFNVERPTSNVPLRERDQEPSSWGWVWRVLAIIIGALFVYAGALKVWDPVRFAGDIENYHILPWPVGVRLAFYLPWVEVICGLALIFRRWYSGALAILLSLMLIFLGATIAAKMRGIDISCGCFGRVSDKLSFAWHMALDLTLLAAVVALFVRAFHYSTAPNEISR
jgi:putative oxidoreductase